MSRATTIKEIIQRAAKHNGIVYDDYARYLANGSKGIEPHQLYLWFREKRDCETYMATCSDPRTKEIDLWITQCSFFPYLVLDEDGTTATVDDNGNYVFGLQQTARQ